MLFPIKDLLEQNIVELYAPVDDQDNCLFDCPCCPEYEPHSIAGIGSYYCRKNCPNSVNNDTESATIKCNNNYWFKCLEREFYKNHG